MSVTLRCHLLWLWWFHVLQLADGPSIAVAADLSDLEVIAEALVDDFDVYSSFLIDLLLQLIDALIHHCLLCIELSLPQVIYLFLLRLWVLNICFVLLYLLWLWIVQFGGQLLILLAQYIFFFLQLLKLSQKVWHSCVLVCVIDSTAFSCNWWWTWVLVDRGLIWWLIEQGGSFLWSWLVLQIWLLLFCWGFSGTLSWWLIWSLAAQNRLILLVDFQSSPIMACLLFQGRDLFVLLVVHKLQAFNNTELHFIILLDHVAYSLLWLQFLLILIYLSSPLLQL